MRLVQLGDGPGLEVARLPVGGELVFVGVVLDQAAGRVPEVPEVRRRHRVPARAELGFPAAAREVQAAAEHLVDVAHGEGHVVEAALARGQLQQEQVVVPALGRAAHEGAAAGVAVGRRRSRSGWRRRPRWPGHVGDEEHHVADLDRRGALVDRRGLVDARLAFQVFIAPQSSLQLALARDLQPHRQAVGVGAADAARAVHFGVDEAGVLRDRGGVARRGRPRSARPTPLRAASGPPPSPAAGRACRSRPPPRGSRSGTRRRARRRSSWARRQAPVVEEAATRGEVVGAVGDLVDTKNAHVRFLSWPTAGAARWCPSTCSSAPCTGRCLRGPSRGPGRCRASRRTAWRPRTACRC